MQEDLILSSYHYHLPEELIAQHPAAHRDASRMMVVRPDQSGVEHLLFRDIARFIAPKDLLVVNDTKVFPARLQGVKESGGKAEVFLLEFPTRASTPGQAEVTVLIKASKRPKPGSLIHIDKDLSCTVIDQLADGKTQVLLNFDPNRDLSEILSRSGQVPLPPYIVRHDGSTEDDRTRYQTVYAEKPGAVAAPTAGLHFTDNLLDKITAQGTRIGKITLHVGYGTFAPVRDEDITRHQIHHEYIQIPAQTAKLVKETRALGGKVWAVGTTSVRALEFSARKSGELEEFSGWCDLYVYPGYTFKVVDNLITNFHLPDSSLMFLVSALCGRKKLLDCYNLAVKERYRFFSFGDAMAIIR